MFTSWNPPNPFHTTYGVPDHPEGKQSLRVVDDHARTILRKNRSPDLGFTWSANPYRGCSHACAYCYARRTHEALDLGAGSDFERVILVKREAPVLLEAAFRKARWKGEQITLSGVTDCYQPIERRLRITRGLLEVCARFRNPVQIITRSPLILRDLDTLRALAHHQAARVVISLPILDPSVSSKLEPGVASPAVRLRTIAALHEAGVPVGVSLAPVIPGLTDHAIPETLQRAHAYGARWAFMSLIRLPGSVAEVFVQRLSDAMPDRAPAILQRIRESRAGALDDSRFGHRHRGTGVRWAMTTQLFEQWATRLNMPPPPLPSPTTPFRIPGAQQLSLFSGG